MLDRSDPGWAGGPWPLDPICSWRKRRWPYRTAACPRQSFTERVVAVPFLVGACVAVFLASSGSGGTAMRSRRCPGRVERLVG